MKEIIKMLESCDTIGDISIKMFGYSNGRTQKKVKEYIIEYGYTYKFLNSLKEKYNKEPKKCKECLNNIDYEKRRNSFCSSKCSAIYNNKIRGTRSNETKKKISLSLMGKKTTRKNIKKQNKFISTKCVICGNIFLTLKRGKYKGKSRIRKTCSDKCYSLLLSNNMNERIVSGKHKGWQSRNIDSYPEKFFKNVLENNNIKYEFNKSISKKSLGLCYNSNYFLDFYLPEKNIDLEIDGQQHKLKERIESDEIRDKCLIENNFIVYRIQWKDINSKKGKEYIKNEIDKFLKYYKNME